MKGTILAVLVGAIGGLISTLLVAIVWTEVIGATMSNSSDTLVASLVAGAAAVATALAWKRPRLRFAFASAFVSSFALAILATDSPYALVALVPLLYGVPFVPHLPARLRLAGSLLTVLVVSLAASGEARAEGFARYSGLATALAVAGYLLLWGLREPVPWARHTAWLLLAAWGLLFLALSLGDLQTFADAIAKATLLASLAMLAVAAWGWTVLKRPSPA